MTLNEIKEILESRGETKTFEASHRFFNAGKTEFNDHKEFLFITKTRRNKKTYRSPLFYVGDKYKIITEIEQKFPKNINKFIKKY